MKRNTLGVTHLKCLLLLLIHEAFSPTLNSNAAQLEAADATLITNLNGSVTAYTFTPLVCFINNNNGNTKRISRSLKRSSYIRIRLMEHIWNRVPSYCLIVSQPDSGKMKPA